MKITQLHLKNFQQFKDLKLDFTHPETGEPLDRVCFIGQNGTGKTTILDLIFGIIKKSIIDGSFFLRYLGNNKQILLDGKTTETSSITVDVVIDGQQFCFSVTNHGIGIDIVSNEFRETVDLTKTTLSNVLNYSIPSRLVKKLEIALSILLKQKNEKQNLIAYSEANKDSFNEPLPTATLNEALKLFNNLPSTAKISGQTVDNFWVLLIYHIKKRESDRHEFENQEHNLNKTKRQLIQEFDAKNVNILSELASVWHKMLERSGLYFDVENANIPIQLTENLSAYIRSKATGDVIPYNRLSTGIKNFIFQIGHIYTLYFSRKIDNSFLLIDEPSNGLYPDFIYELIGIYESVVSPNTQMFVATHNPIIAAQFHPYERFILEFNEDDLIKIRRGVAPIGDDPVDILEDDFLVQNIMPKEGMEAWQRFINLKREIHYLNKQKPFKNGEQEKLNHLLEEMSTIGRKYNF